MQSTQWTYLRKSSIHWHKDQSLKCFKGVCIACVQNWRAQTKLTHFSRLSEGWKKDWLCTRRRRQMFIYSQGGVHSLRRRFNMLVCLCAHSTLNGSLSALAWLYMGLQRAALRGRLGDYSDVDKFWPTLAAFVVVTWKIDLWCVCVRKRGPRTHIREREALCVCAAGY